MKHNMEPQHNSQSPRREVDSYIREEMSKVFFGSGLGDLANRKPSVFKTIINPFL